MAPPGPSPAPALRRYLKLKAQQAGAGAGAGAARAHVARLARGAVRAGEAHSALLLAPRGAGKTQLISSVLAELEEDPSLSEDAIVVRLNGLLHHDDKLALEAITTQMKLENAVGDRVFGTFAENLAFLLNCLRTGEDRRCKSMIFILDEFHMFCHTGHTQTLLYNLFDITHSKQAPMFVLGVTSRLDVMELLEKRVKSRFSHRHIFIFPNEPDENSPPKTPTENFIDIFVELLSLPLQFNVNKPTKNIRSTKTANKKGISHKSAKKPTRVRRSTLKMDDDDSSNDSDYTADDTRYALPLAVLERWEVDVSEFETLDVDFVEDWNAHVKGLSESTRVVDAIEKFCYYTVNEQIFRDVLFQLISRLCETQCYFEVNDIVSIIDKTVCPEHRVLQLQSLSILELSLVIAMKHGMEIFDGQPMNFEMVLHRYTKFATTNSTTQSVPRPVILKAFEHLQSLEIIAPVRNATDSVGRTVNRVQKEYQLFTLSVPMQDIQEAVARYKNLPTEIAHWLNNSIV